MLFKICTYIIGGQGPPLAVSTTAHETVVVPQLFCGNVERNTKALVLRGHRSRAGWVGRISPPVGWPQRRGGSLAVAGLLLTPYRCTYYLRPQMTNGAALPRSAADKRWNHTAAPVSRCDWWCTPLHHMRHHKQREQC